MRIPDTEGIVLGIGPLRRRDLEVMSLHVSTRQQQKVCVAGATLNGPESLEMEASSPSKLCT